ncbi:MAG: nucleoside hydrolase [Gammaproteobacteria bacterium]|nr:nucleoside hydrolase [Gammaproteobacteria bacterium]
MKKIIIDTDPGIDDAQAIAFALAHPDLDLVGLTTIFGNVDVELATRNALLISELFNAAELPVARGAAVPLVQDRLPAPDFVHGTDGLGNLDLPASGRTPDKLEAAGFIVEMAKRYPGEITLVAVGPLTNIALAVELDPGLPDRLHELVIMGGTLREPGNVSPVSEANFLNDPHAADRVLAHDWPATIIGLDVTHRILLTDTDLSQLRDSAGAVGRFLWDSSRFYVDFYSSKGAAVGAAERSCAMHDATAVVYLVRRDDFSIVSGPARVAENGVAVGQLILDTSSQGYHVPHWQGRPDSHVAVEVSAESVRRTFLDRVISHFG